MPNFPMAKDIWGEYLPKCLPNQQAGEERNLFCWK